MFLQLTSCIGSRSRVVEAAPHSSSRSSHLQCAGYQMLLFSAAAAQLSGNCIFSLTTAQEYSRGSRSAVPATTRAPTRFVTPLISSTGGSNLACSSHPVPLEAG